MELKIATDSNPFQPRGVSPAGFLNDFFPVVFYLNQGAAEIQKSAVLATETKINDRSD